MENIPLELFTSEPFCWAVPHLPDRKFNLLVRRQGACTSVLVRFFRVARHKGVYMGNDLGWHHKGKARAGTTRRAMLEECEECTDVRMYGCTDVRIWD